MSTKSALQSILEGILSSEERIKDAHNSLPEEMQVNNTTMIKKQIGKHYSAMTINVTNPPIKRYRVTAWIRKQDSSLCCLQETYLGLEDRQNLKAKRWEKADEMKRQVGVII